MVGECTSQSRGNLNSWSNNIIKEIYRNLIRATRVNWDITTVGMLLDTSNDDGNDDEISAEEFFCKRRIGVKKLH